MLPLAPEHWGHATHARASRKSVTFTSNGWPVEKMRFALSTAYDVRCCLTTFAPFSPAHDACLCTCAMYGTFFSMSRCSVLENPQTEGCPILGTAPMVLSQPSREQNTHTNGGPSLRIKHTHVDHSSTRATCGASCPLVG